MPESQRFRFAGYEFDAATGELTGPGGRRRLEPQPARVLALLLDRGGELVTREDLRREVWPDTHVDFDQGLNYCIRQIRNALGEAADSPGLLETLPRRGYRFVAAVEKTAAVEAVEAAGAGGAAGAEAGGTAASAGTVGPVERPAQTESTASTPPATSRRRLVLAFTVVVLLALAAVGSWRLGEHRPAPAADPPAIRLAVLPFHGTDKPTSPWEDRFGEALVVALTERGAGRVAVVGPATTAPLAGEGLPQGELGRRLGADLVVSGGIRRDGQSVFVQLLRAPGGEHLWATVLPLGDADAAGRQTADAVLAAVAEAAFSRTPDGPGRPAGGATERAPRAP